MAIRIWQSYSCNNSSSFRLVARFADAGTARATAAVFAAFFTTHAEQRDAMFDGDEGDIDGHTAAAEALAKKYGFSWTHSLGWGDDVQVGDEPTVAALDDTLAVYHTYCSGFGEIDKYLAARGATQVDEAMDAPTLTVLVPAGSNPQLDAEVATALAWVELPRDKRAKVTSPHAWLRRIDDATDLIHFRDAKTAGLYFPIDPEDIGAVRTWLDGHGVTARSAVSLCTFADAEVFRAVAGARCSGCDGALEYLDPRVHDIETGQLACRRCGGLYEVATFVKLARDQAKAASKPEKPKPAKPKPAKPKPAKSKPAESKPKPKSKRK